MRRIFPGLAALLLFLVVAQFFFAATGAFSDQPQDEAFAAHLALGWVIFALPVAMAVSAGVARLPARLAGLSALVAALTSLQVAIALTADAAGDTTAGRLIFGLHAVNGLAILAVAVVIAHRSRSLGPSRAPSVAGRR